MKNQPTIDPILRDQALGSAIQYHIRDVVKAAADTVYLLKPQNNESGMKNNQMSNVVNVAISAQSVEEIAAFLLYQMGRSTNNRQWLYGKFGDTVVQHLLQGEVKKAALNAQIRAAKRIDKANQGTLSDKEQKKLHDEAHIALARQYLGYLGRLFYFANNTQGWERLVDFAAIDAGGKK